MRTTSILSSMLLLMMLCGESAAQSSQTGYAYRITGDVGCEETGLPVIGMPVVCESGGVIRTTLTFADPDLGPLAFFSLQFNGGAPTVTVTVGNITREYDWDFNINTGEWFPICNYPPGCFLEGTAISMFDGSTKPIEQIKVGDNILAYDEESGEMKADRVKLVHEPVERGSYLLLNKTIRLTREHPVLSAGTWVQAGQLTVGGAVTGEDGNPVMVRSIEMIDGPVMVYNFAVNPFETFVADGIIVHNKNIPGNAAGQDP